MPLAPQYSKDYKGAEPHGRPTLAKAEAPVVLVVDDEPDVLELASMILSLQGYTVVEAANGAEALETLREQPKIEVLFTDIVMPGGLDGFELAHQAKQLRPDLR